MLNGQAIEAVGEAVAKAGPKMLTIGKAIAIAAGTFMLGIGAGVSIKSGVDKKKAKKNSLAIEEAKNALNEVEAEKAKMTDIGNDKK